MYKQLLIFAIFALMSRIAICQNYKVKPNAYNKAMPYTKILNQESVKSTNLTYKKYISGKTSSISTTPLGKSSNAYSVLRNTQNQVFYNPEMDMIGFIHRQNVNDWGGTPTASSNGVLRLDVSIDGGATFNVDMADNGLNPLPNPSYCRYPQAVLHNPDGNVDPCSTKVVWNGATTSG